MNLFLLKRIIEPVGVRTIIHGKRAEIIKAPEPVKMAFTCYEDTQTRDTAEMYDAPPLLVMHGLFGSKSNWSSICKNLHRSTKPNRKIIAVDARNHGESPHSSEHNYDAMVADVYDLLKVNRIPKISFIGHSMGGRTAMLFALNYPHLIENLIIVDISPISTPSDLKNMWKYFGAMSAIRVPPNSTLSAARTAVDAALMSAVPDKSVRSFLLTNLVLKANGLVDWRINLRALRENYAQLARFPVGADSGKMFTGRTLFVGGGRSDYLKQEDHQAIRALFPSARFVTLADAGHWLHSERPTDFIQIVLKVLNKDL